jgi:hypothetical protein
MTDQTQSQLLGIALATLTAVGCLAYERLVKAYSIGVILTLTLVFYIPFLVGILFWNGRSLGRDLIAMTTEHPWSALVYWATFLTTPIWFIITKRQSVLAGGIYEMKYLVVLAAGYAIFGARGITTNIVIGLILALMSVWFVSRG